MSAPASSIPIQGRIDENNQLLDEWEALLDSSDWNAPEKLNRGLHCRKKVHDNLGALAKQVEFQIARQKELKAKNSIVGTSNSQSEDIDVSSEKKLDIYSAEHKENS